MTTISNQSATPAAVRALRTTRVPLSTPRSSTSTRREISYSNIKASIILDLGSTIWKVGVAGEVKPRTCLRNQIEFKLNLEEEEEALMKHRIMVELRKLWIKSVLS